MDDAVMKHYYAWVWGCACDERRLVLRVDVRELALILRKLQNR